MSGGGHRPEARILESAAALFQELLAEPDLGRMARSRLKLLSVDPATIRDFGLGYAPRDVQLVRERLPDFGLDELIAAGIIVLAENGSPTIELHSRIVFPVRDAEGLLLGFAGRATHAGPSWPEWLTSPESGRFTRTSALFALDAAAEHIRAKRRVLFSTNPLGALLAQQAGEAAAVGLARSELGVGHLEVVGELLGAGPEELTAREVPADEGQVLLEIAPGSPDAVARSGAVALIATRAKDHSLSSRGGGVVPDAHRPPSRAVRILRLIGASSFGVAIPLAWFFLVGSDGALSAKRTAFIGMLLGVGATFLALLAAVSFVAGRARARSRARRMRDPWVHGGGEWQPAGWTHHWIEDGLIVAAVVSIVMCFVLFFAIEGYTA